MRSSPGAILRSARRSILSNGPVLLTGSAGFVTSGQRVIPGLRPAYYGSIENPAIQLLRLERALACSETRASELQDRIRTLAADSVNVIFTHHAADRMVERGIDDKDVYHVLETGLVDIKSIETGKTSGDWKCKVTQRIRGSREVGVITVVGTGDKLIIITTEWEDLP